jgi:hypothetical protein
VPLHLAGDRRDREGGELAAARGVVALDRVQEPDRAGLDEVVVLRPGALVPVRECLDQGQIELDEPVARPRVAIASIGRQKAPGR